MQEIYIYLSFKLTVKVETDTFFKRNLSKGNTSPQSQIVPTISHVNSEILEEEIKTENQAKSLLTFLSGVATFFQCVLL